MAEGKLRVTLLGTGPSQGVPGLHDGWGACDPGNPRNQRLRTSALIEAPSGVKLLVDAGPDVRAQLLAAGTAEIHGLFVTHAHADHITGLDDMRSVNRATGRALPLFADAETLAILRRRFDYCFLPPTRGFYRPAFEVHEVAPGDEIALPGLRARVFEQDHRVVRTLGLRVGGFAYSTDVVAFPAPSEALLEGLDTWVVGCFQRAPHPVHADLATVLGWKARFQPRRMVLTHMGNALDEARLRAELPPGVEPGFDGQVLEVPISTARRVDGSP
jgi:phosphoribosyl 1,2-cyclic phosphate phosphodiesterase